MKEVLGKIPPNSSATAEKPLVRGGQSAGQSSPTHLEEQPQPRRLSATTTLRTGSRQHRGEALRQQKDCDSLKTMFRQQCSAMKCVFTEVCTLLRYTTATYRAVYTHSENPPIFMLAPSAAGAWAEPTVEADHSNSVHRPWRVLHSPVFPVDYEAGRPRLQISLFSKNSSLYCETYF